MDCFRHVLLDTAGIYRYSPQNVAALLAARAGVADIVLCPRPDGNKMLLGIQVPYAIAIYRTELLRKRELQTG